MVQHHGTAAGELQLCQGCRGLRRQQEVLRAVKNGRIGGTKDESGTWHVGIFE
jgi:hypothetical protein